MGKSGDNITAEKDAGSSDRHPCLSADFDERLAVARKQRKKVLAERAAAAAAAGEALFPTVTTPEQPVWGTRATQNEPQIETRPDHAPIRSMPGLYRNPKSMPKDGQKKPWPVIWQLRWIATAALAGMLVGSVGTVILLESRSTGYETDIVSRAALQPDALATNVSRVPDRSLRLTAPRTDISIDKSTATPVTFHSSTDTSSPGAALRFSQSATPVVQLNMPDLGNDLSGANIGVARSPVGDLPIMVRTEPMRQSQIETADGKPSVDLGSLAPTLATWNVVMTTPRQDQSGQASSLFLKWPDQVAYHPALRWPVPKDDFNCQGCLITALPAAD